jgi:hypothetical protein
LLIMLSFPENRCYMSHLMLIVDWASNLPLHRGSYFDMGRHGMCLSLLLLYKASISLC